MSLLINEPGVPAGTEPAKDSAGAIVAVDVPGEARLAVHGGPFQRPKMFREGHWEPIHDFAFGHGIEV